MSSVLKLENFMPYRLAVLSNTVSTTVARAYDKRFNVSIPEWRVIAVLRREFADSDKRRSILNLSEAGSKLHDEIAALALGFERDLLEGLSPEELEQLNGIMERLLARARLIGTP